MKSQIEKLGQMSVTALKAKAKRLGGKLVTPDGKAKTKQQLINTIVMKNRLAGRSMGANHTGTAKKPAAKNTMAKKPAAKTMAGNQNYSDLPDLRVFLIKILPATDTLGQRISIVDVYFGVKVIIPFGYKGGATMQAMTYMNSKAIKFIGGQTDYLVSKNMTISIQ